ncbi:FAD binding domain-containing protein [Paenibacillus sp. CC-CFT747]|nr:FAD binding domain-containing protein [Paenibacillus sp. CC-CFT747]
MISFDFEYHRPQTLAEAVQTYQRLDKAGRQPLYYGGGTEIITMARLNRLYTGAVIDIKSVPEGRLLHTEGGTWGFGSALTLSEAAAANGFPLLKATLRHLSDRTTRNKTTLGGNVCGHIHYRESLLPFLLADAQGLVVGPAGMRLIPVETLFSEGKRLPKDDLLLQLRLDSRYAEAPFYHRKRTRVGRNDYPLVTVAALLWAGRVRIAISGLCAFPFRSAEMEEKLNQPGQPPAARIETAVRAVPAPILNDILGSDTYRVHLLRLSLLEAITMLEGGGWHGQSDSAI